MLKFLHIAIEDRPGFFIGHKSPLTSDIKSSMLKNDNLKLIFCSGQLEPFPVRGVSTGLELVSLHCRLHAVTHV